MSSSIRVYRAVLRELGYQSNAGRHFNRSLATQFRSLVERANKTQNSQLSTDVQNAADFMKAQRKYQDLLDRYNPTMDLTSQERVKATARRVGLDMPLAVDPIRQS